MHFWAQTCYIPGYDLLVILRNRDTRRHMYRRRINRGRRGENWVQNVRSGLMPINKIDNWTGTMLPIGRSLGRKDLGDILVESKLLR